VAASLLSNSVRAGFPARRCAKAGRTLRPDAASWMLRPGLPSFFYCHIIPRTASSAGMISFDLFSTISYENKDFFRQSPEEWTDF
jgi:hypothetical protein